MAADVSSEPGSPVRVLLVEDHAATRRQVGLLVDGQADMTVVGDVGSAEEAIDLVGRLTPDVVIMDLMLPGMNGVDATRHILAQRPETRVLALSNHCGTALVRVVLDAGCIGYVRKDAAAEELLPAIRSVAVGTQYVGTLLKDPSPKWRTV